MFPCRTLKVDEGPCANDPSLCHSCSLCSCLTFISFNLPLFQSAASRQCTSPSLAFSLRPKRFGSFWSHLLEAFPVVLSLFPPSLSLWYHRYFLLLTLFLLFPSCPSPLLVLLFYFISCNPFRQIHWWNYYMHCFKYVSFFPWGVEREWICFALFFMTADFSYIKLSFIMAGKELQIIKIAITNQLESRCDESNLPQEIIRKNSN